MQEFSNGPRRGDDPSSEERQVHERWVELEILDGIGRAPGGGGSKRERKATQTRRLKKKELGRGRKWKRSCLDFPVWPSKGVDSGGLDSRMVANPPYQFGDAISEHNKSTGRAMLWAMGAKVKKRKGEEGDGESTE